MSRAMTMTLAELAGRISRQLEVALTAADDWQRFAQFLDLARDEVSRFDLSDPAVVLGTTDRLEWAAVIIRSAGRTGLILMAPLPPGEPGRSAASPSTAAAIRQAVALLVGQERAHKMGLLQALLPPTQTHEARLLADCGFVRLAELIYLMGDLPGLPAPHDPPRKRPPATGPGAAAAWPALPSDSWVLYNDHTADDFVRVIRASYVHTLDCPSLEGVRRMEDVLAGHKASGLFRPDLWFMFTRGGEPIGAVLLNQVLDPSCPTVELVYMGLAESARGLGLGGRMFRFAMHSARRAGFDRIVTAVDAENLPALTLYRHAGLNETMRRIACILPLEQADSHGA